MDQDTSCSIILRSGNQYACIERYKVNGWTLVEGICMLDADNEKFVCIDLEGNVKKL